MQVDTLPRYRLTIDDFQKMGEVGIFHPEERLELIEGELIRMAPIGDKHVGMVLWLTRFFDDALAGKAIVSVQNPLRLGTHSEPQPDIAILRPRDDFYMAGKPTSEDVLLLVEVADTTLHYDREIKIPLYAHYGIPEVWLIDVPNERMEIYLRPGQDGYRQMLRPEPDEQISPSLLPNVLLDLGRLWMLRNRKS